MGPGYQGFLLHVKVVPSESTSNFYCMTANCSFIYVNVILKRKIERTKKNRRRPIFPCRVVWHPLFKSHEKAFLFGGFGIINNLF